LVVAVAAVALSSPDLIAAQQKQRLPNFVIVFTDDQGYKSGE